MKLIRIALSIGCLAAMLWIVFDTVLQVSRGVGNASSIVAFGSMAFLVGSMVLFAINSILGHWDE